MEIEIVEPSIELIEYTVCAEQHIERCGREAYGSAVSANLKDTQEWVRKRIRGGEEDVVEHAVATWYIVCSRVVSHELVRHRLASYTQMSQRFTEQATLRVVLPPNLGDLERALFLEGYQSIRDVYEAFRKMLPQTDCSLHSHRRDGH